MRGIASPHGNDYPNRSVSRDARCYFFFFFFFVVFFAVFFFVAFFFFAGITDLLS